jgi:hypothetical protein
MNAIVDTVEPLHSGNFTNAKLMDAAIVRQLGLKKPRLAQYDSENMIKEPLLDGISKAYPT